MFDLELEWTVGVGGGGGTRGLCFPTLTSLLVFDRLPPSWYKFFFSPQSSAAIKTKDGGNNFRQENTDQSLTKITPALWAKIKQACYLVL